MRAEDLRYPRALRLRRAQDFRLVLARGEVYPGRQALVRRLARPGEAARLGISASRRYGGAVARNRFRRLVREAFRLEQAALAGFDYLVSPRRGLVEPTLEGVRADLLATRTARPAPPRRPQTGKA